MPIETLLLFIATETALCLSPGPAVLLVVAVALSRGVKTSLAANLGILAANGIYFLLSAMGLAALLLASHDVFFAIKWIGAGYLVFLGLKALFRKSSPFRMTTGSQETSASALRTFGHGFVLQTANPKTILFFAALLPQFIDPAAGQIPLQFVILGIASVTIEFFVLLGYGLIAGQARRFADRQWFQTWNNRVAGGLLIGAGVGLAAIRRGA